VEAGIISYIWKVGHLSKRSHLTITVQVFQYKASTLPGASHMGPKIITKAYYGQLQQSHLFSIQIVACFINLGSSFFHYSALITQYIGNLIQTDTQ
jgi:hypothetical protein